MFNRSNDEPETFVFDFLSQSDIPECINIAITNFDDFQQNPEYIRSWFEQRIVHNPWQAALPGIGVGIRLNGRLVGFRAMFAQPWWLNGQSTLIAFCANTNVDYNFRGKGLATQLIDRSRKFCSITGSVTAGNITQKAYKKLGYVEIGGNSNDFYRVRASYRGSWEKRIGKPLGSWLGKIFDIKLQLRDAKLAEFSDFSLEEVFHCGEEFDSLWEKAKPGYISCLERSSSYLNWRLFDYPTCQLRLLALKNNENTLKAYAIWHQQDFSDSISMAVLRDVFYLLDDQASLRTLLFHLLNYWRNLGIVWVSLEVASPQLTALFRSLGYDPIPSHGNRYQIYSEPPLAGVVLENWFRSAIDGDYFDHPL